MSAHRMPSTSSNRRSYSTDTKHSLLLRAALRLSFLVLAVAAIAYWGVSIWDAFTDLSYDIDFPTFFAAALALRDNSHANIFDLHILQAVAAAHGAPMPQYLYIYPQLLAMLLIPLTLLPFNLALLIWRLLSLVLWLMGACILVRWIARYYTPSTRASSTPEHEFNGTPESRDLQIFVATVALLLSFAYFPLAYGVHEGQVASLTFYLMLLAPFLYTRHPRLVGGVLALVLWIKVYPAVLIGYFLLTKRWHVVCSAVVWTLGIGLGVFLFIGWHDMSLLANSIVSNGNLMGSIPWNVAVMNVPRWILISIGGPGGSIARLLGYALLGIIGGGFVVVVGTTQRVRQLTSSGGITDQNETDTPVLELLGYSWALCTMVVLSPVTWIHTYVWLLPSFIVCLGVAFHRWLKQQWGVTGTQVPGIALLLTLLVAYAAVNAPPQYFDATQSTEQLFVHHPINLVLQLFHPIGALVLWGINGFLFLRVAGVSYRQLVTQYSVLLAFIPSVPSISRLILLLSPRCECAASPVVLPDDSTLSRGEHSMFPAYPTLRFWAFALIVVLGVLEGMQMLYWQLALAASEH